MEQPRLETGKWTYDGSGTGVQEVDAALQRARQAADEGNIMYAHRLLYALPEVSDPDIQRCIAYRRREMIEYVNKVMRLRVCKGIR